MGYVPALESAIRQSIDVLAMSLKISNAGELKADISWVSDLPGNRSRPVVMVSLNGDLIGTCSMTDCDIAVWKAGRDPLVMAYGLAKVVRDHIKKLEAQLG